MNQLLTGDVWKQVNELIKKKQNLTACIAYVTTHHLKLSRNDILLCDASAHAIKYGKTSAKTLAYYFEKGVTLYSVDGLHAKLLYNNELVVFGSANLSANSAENLTEAACVSTNKTLISQARSFCDDLADQLKPVSRTKLQQLLRIKVIRHPPYRPKPTTTRSLKFGDKYWYLSLGPLSQQAYASIQQVVEKNSAIIAKEKNIDEENIAFVQYPKDSKFAKEVKPGDQIVVRWTNKSKTRVQLRPPCTVLQKKQEGRFIHLYTNESETGEPVSWTKFQKFAQRTFPNKQFTAWTRVLSEEDINILMPLWTKK